MIALLSYASTAIGETYVSSKTDNGKEITIIAGTGEPIKVGVIVDEKTGEIRLKIDKQEFAASIAEILEKSGISEWANYRVVIETPIATFTLPEKMDLKKTTISVQKDSDNRYSVEFVTPSPNPNEPGKNSTLGDIGYTTKTGVKLESKPKITTSIKQEYVPVMTPRGPKVLLKETYWTATKFYFDVQSPKQEGQS